ncbi:MAG TPA: hypothetical protein VKJ45_12510 [Blastocatellia bacterium]|nr:hypothetical protein [Blastocatellia bacterium]
MDRVTGAGSQTAGRDKLARDFYQKDYQELPQKQQDDVDDLHGKLWNPAGTSGYLKKGLSFAEAHHLLLEAYRAETDKQYPQEIRSALMDFARGLEKDISEAAKAGGFYPEFSKAEKSLRAAVKEIRANGNN